MLSQEQSQPPAPTSDPSPRPSWPLLDFSMRRESTHGGAVRDPRAVLSCLTGPPPQEAQGMSPSSAEQRLGGLQGSKGRSCWPSLSLLALWALPAGLSLTKGPSPPWLVTLHQAAHPPGLPPWAALPTPRAAPSMEPWAGGTGAKSITELHCPHPVDPWWGLGRAGHVKELRGTEPATKRIVRNKNPATLKMQSPVSLFQSLAKLHVLPS